MFWVSTIAMLFYLGGMIPAYRHGRENVQRFEGFNRFLWFWGLVNALIWPADVGWHLAQRYCETHKG